MRGAAYSARSRSHGGAGPGPDRNAIITVLKITIPNCRSPYRVEVNAICIQRMRPFRGEEAASLNQDVLGFEQVHRPRGTVAHRDVSQH